MTTFRFAGLAFNSSDGRLARNNGAGEHNLRPQVARLLGAFVEQPQCLIGREQLCRAVWDKGVVVDFESGLAAVLRELRAELKQLHAPDDLIETVPRRGYRLRVAVKRDEGRTILSNAGRKRLLGFSVALLLLLAAGVQIWSGKQQPLAPEHREWTLAVLPFDQFGEPDQGPRQLDLLLADQILGELWEQRLQRVVLIGRASLAPYRSRSDHAAAVAEALDIDLLVEGSISFEGDQVRILARLLKMPAGEILWSHQLEHVGVQPPSAQVLAQVLTDSLAIAWQERLAEQIVTE